MWRVASRDVSTSPNGEFELERFVGLWDDEDQTGTWWVLRERATGVLPLDSSNVKKGDVRWTADGGLLVRLQHGANNSVFRVDLGERTFRDLARVETPQPIEGLQAAVDAATRKIGADGRPPEPPCDYIERDFSPDGSIMIEFLVEPQRMSHETRTPRIVETATGRELLNISDSLFDGSLRWFSDTGFDLYLRHYARPGGLTVRIDMARRTFSFPQEGNRVYSIERLQAQAEPAFDRVARQIEKAARPDPAVHAGRLLVMLVGAVLILAAVFAVAWWLQEPPRQPLAPLPFFNGR